MTNKILNLFLFLFLFATGAAAQSTNQITQRCASPYQRTYASVILPVSGNVLVTPCATKATIFNGIVDLSAASLFLNLTNNTIPYYTTASGLISTPFTYNGTDLDVKTGAGVITMGDTGTPQGNGTAFRLSDGQQRITLFTGTTGASGLILNGEGTTQTTSLGDVNLLGNGTRLVIDDIAGSYRLRNVATTGLLNLTDIQTVTVQKTITAIGTTGNVTINKQAGTVNIAGGASAATVTNSTVTANSIISVTARTNDTTCTVKNYVPGSGTFTVNMTANCTAATSVGFIVWN